MLRITHHSVDDCTLSSLHRLRVQSRVNFNAISIAYVPYTSILEKFFFNTMMRICIIDSRIVEK